MTLITSPITDLTIGGTSVDLSTVEWSIGVRHGRNDVSSAPESSSAIVTILHTNADSIIGDVSDELYVEAHGQARFTGRVTDMRIAHVPGVGGNPPLTMVTYEAIGNLSRLGFYILGADGFDEETLSERVLAILDGTDLTYTAQTGPGTVLLAEPAALRSALDWLTDLCVQTGATMADLPDGSIMVEAYTRRGYDYDPASWALIEGAWEDLSGDWTQQEAAFSDAGDPVELPAGAVLWEPAWTKTITTVINDVTVTYGDSDPQATVNDQSTVSKTQHGVRATVLETRLRDETDATARAGQIITAQGSARWNMQQVEIFVDLLDTPTRSAVLDLVSGKRVLITGLPEPTPLTTYLGVVEGWGETFTPSGHSIVLSLSDPRYSYAMVSWGELDPAATWADVDIGLAWADLILASDLT